MPSPTRSHSSTHPRPRRSRWAAAEGVRAPGRSRPLAFGAGVAGVRRDHPARVRLEPVRRLPITERLRLRGVELVRAGAAEPVPGVDARSAVAVALPAGVGRDRLCGGPVRVTVGGALVPQDARLVLS